MKRLTKAFILPMVLGSIVIAACTDDFLDTTNSETLSSGNFPTRIEDVDLLVNDIYGRLRNGFFDAYPQSRIGYGASHYADQAFSDNNFDAGAQINFDPNNSDVQEMWDKHYENISRANGALDAIERLRATDDLTSDVQTTLDRREGEVRFIRALNYFYLINFFGESFITQPSDADKPGVPIIEKVATTLAETRVEKSTVGQVWAYIKADLNAAATLLDDVVWDGNDVARVNEWAIKGFLGKAHVFTQDWADAVTVLRDVIDNSGRTLVAYDIYANMFNNQNTFNNESLFELNFNDQQVNTDWSNTSNANTYFPILISPSFINSGGGLDCNGFCNFIVHDRSLLRFGWTDTTRNDYNRADYFALAQNIRDNQLADPRLWVSAQQPFVDSITVNDELVAIAKNRGEGIQAVIGSLYGWSFRKLTLTNRGIWAGPGNQIAMNMYWLRMADVFLLYAEASQNNGDVATALEYVNKVRRRAYGLDIDTPSAVDYGSLSDATMASAGDHLANDPLKYERWAELFGEHGSWWFDVCRWRIGQQEATYYQQVATAPLTWNDNKYALPIPQTQINAFNIGQNPGY